jgi:ATP-dependent DNA ligase
VDVSRVRFIPPAVPKLRASPPTGANWSYEVKLDGFRVQLHKVGLAVTLFGKNGGNLTTRFPTIAAAVITLPVRSCIINGELIAAVVRARQGQPDQIQRRFSRPHCAAGRVHTPRPRGHRGEAEGCTLPIRYAIRLD